MSRDLKTYNLLLDYLNRSLGKEEKLTLEKQWKDPEAKKELMETAAIEQSGDQYYLKKFEVLHQEMKVKKQRRTILLWGGLAAAAILVLLFLFGPATASFFQSKNKRYYAEAYEIPPSLSDRGDTNQYDFQEPEQIISQLSTKQKLTALEHRAIAIAFMETKDFEKAISHLSQISGDSFVKDQALWYQSLSYLKLEKPQQAKELLEQLQLEHSKSSYATKAADLLQKLSN